MTFTLDHMPMDTRAEEQSPFAGALARRFGSMPEIVVARIAHGVKCRANKSL